MPLTLGWQDIATRLALTVLAGILFGINRTEHGRPAGLRTTLLVGLAAAVAMIQTNLLLGISGKPADSFATLDLMRLPLGILSGMGFIGAGTILRRGDLILGITTAATLWFVTVLGLCFGGGQLALGLVAMAIGLAVLWGLQWFERQLPRDHHATLVVTLAPDHPTEQEVRDRIRAAGFRVVAQGLSYDAAQGRRELSCHVSWRSRSDELPRPAFLDELARSPGVSRFMWSPQGQPPDLG
jgi:putative Mg2+ transporter-C (MgtC) family protein